MSNEPKVVIKEGEKPYVLVNKMVHGEMRPVKVYGSDGKKVKQYVK